MSFTRDVTNRVLLSEKLFRNIKVKQAKTNLIKANEVLETRVQQRTIALVKANKALNIEIAERRQAEEALRRKQYILTSAQRVAHVGSWEMNAVTGELRCSDEFLRICGMDPESVKPSLALALSVVHPDEREAVKEAISATYGEGKAFKTEYRIVRQDG